MRSFIFLLTLSVLVARGSELCPDLVGVLTIRAGDANSATSGRRLQIRRCSIRPSSGIGVIQLAVWAEGATQPDLVIETEARSFRQIVFTEDSIAAEMVGGSSSRVFGIEYRADKPVLAVTDSSRNKTIITSDGSQITIETYDDDARKAKYVLGRQRG